MVWYTADVRTFSAEEYEAAFAMLDENKKARVMRIRQKKDKLRTVVGDKLARDLLARELKCAPEDVRFCYEENGKPYLEGNPLYFNLSHCEDLVVCAISKSPIGIDVEQLRDMPPRLAKKFFTPDECLYIFGHEPKDADWDGSFSPVQRLRFFEIWTSKEAYIKCVGQGLDRLRYIDTLSHTFERHLLKEDYLVTIYQESFGLF
ncbi:MAG: 4'-phosphopantetheinyl transferase superfamily protein [Clostridia bacterium]|nr:4'-phosphopantetheinyl transferase superfamily protein [Clostridia bacterium]